MIRRMRWNQVQMQEGEYPVETLYKVLLALCALFLLAGLIYILFYLPQVPSAPAQPGQSWGGFLSA